MEFQVCQVLPFVKLGLWIFFAELGEDGTVASRDLEPVLILSYGSNDMDIVYPLHGCIMGRPHGRNSWRQGDDEYRDPANPYNPTGRV